MTNINIFQMKKQLDDNKKLLELIKGFLDNSVENVYEKIFEIETKEEQLTKLEMSLYSYLIHFKDDLQNILINNLNSI
tara:strand:+ start:533 stop:766 length:234 start_codon:yes stop_codon:yes gene_type:complete